MLKQKKIKSLHFVKQYIRGMSNSTTELGRGAFIAQGCYYDVIQNRY